MSPSRYSDIGRAGYFERVPEKLVLEGYRCWTYGLVMRSTEPWTEAQLLYRGLLGMEAGERAIIALAGFVKTLGMCAACPLRMFRSGSTLLCRDEALVMGLIAGIQNCDEPAVAFCLDTLCRAGQREEAAMAAGAFALTLKSVDRVMMPIPARVLARVAARSADADDDAVAARTFH